MKVIKVAIVMLAGLFLMAPAEATPPEKFDIAVQQVDGKVLVTIVPTGDYKWNPLYPAKIKFSVCNENECSFFEKEISVEKK